MTLLPHCFAIMPTRNRPEMLQRSIHDFLAQEYDGPLTLLIEDDSDRLAPPCRCVEIALQLDEGSGWFVPGERQIIYRWQRQVRNTATKRNEMIGRVVSDEAVFAIWDDDDLHGPHRLRRQVEALQRNPEAEVCLLLPWTLYDTASHRTAANNQIDTDGTAVFRRAYWERQPWDESPAGFSGPKRLSVQLEQAPASIVRVGGGDDYVVVRHAANATPAPSASYRGGPWKGAPALTADEARTRIRSSAACPSPRRR